MTALLGRINLYLALEKEKNAETASSSVTDAGGGAGGGGVELVMPVTLRASSASERVGWADQVAGTLKSTLYSDFVYIYIYIYIYSVCVCVCVCMYVCIRIYIYNIYSDFMYI